MGPAAEAVVLIPSWQAEEKCEGLCAGEAVHHGEVLPVRSVKQTRTEGLDSGLEGHDKKTTDGGNSD